MKIVDLAGKEIKGKKIVVSSYLNKSKVMESVGNDEVFDYNNGLFLGLHCISGSVFKLWNNDPYKGVIALGELENIELENGKVYRFKGTNCVYMKTGERSGYGFEYGNHWTEATRFAFNQVDLWEEFSIEKFKEMLLLEAEKRGFAEGVKFNCLNKSDVDYVIEIGIHDKGHYISVMSGSPYLIMNWRGEWATVVKEDQFIFTIKEKSLTFTTEKMTQKEFDKLITKTKI